MNRKSRISFGPGAASLILIVVVLSMSVLGILALMNAHNDYRLTSRSIEVIRAEYELNEAAERSLAAIDTLAASLGRRAPDDEAYIDLMSVSLPAGYSVDGNIVSWVETDGYRTLDCAVELLPLGGEKRLQWVGHKMTAITEDVWN